MNLQYVALKGRRITIPIAGGRTGEEEGTTLWHAV